MFPKLTVTHGADGRQIRVYRATFGTTPVRVQFSLTPEGKISGLGISPID